ncbi:DNA-binding helix-turn-helix protein [Mobiluncus holmesii ATCC 35242]|uniref:DNA-binding helix-turn-helix protein n=1 Tax=Mobiluncus holmesii ATCC 35242 TaxID=887899 RepID=E6M3Y2_9ACTO|nr:DNA-binding helix-turn-helix protein [Mobiluncus holmesii ATCC 35242]MCV0021810.1 helix-turn-helix transcriptional regulator [Mobiluncus curtisii]STY88401.1 anaerobic benzoate catabolism transcriptional regulator [Mobiluncus holmesii]
MVSPRLGVGQGNKYLTKLVKLIVMNKTATFSNMKLPYALRPGTSLGRSVRPANRAGVRNAPKKRYSESMMRIPPVAKPSTPVLRHELGEVLRQLRQTRGLTLRDVSAKARVSLGYLSEVERGQKEASSELLASICYALEAPVSFVLHEVADRIAAVEGVVVPELVPDELLDSIDCAPIS